MTIETPVDMWRSMTSSEHLYQVAKIMCRPPADGNAANALALAQLHATVAVALRLPKEGKQ